VRLLGVGEVLGVADNSEEEGAGRTPRNLLTEAEVGERDLEQVAAGARVRVRREPLVPLHILDLHLVVRRHLAGTLAPFLDVQIEDAWVFGAAAKRYCSCVRGKAVVADNLWVILVKVHYYG
jgi:hypothetical protein